MVLFILPPLRICSVIPQSPDWGEKSTNNIWDCHALVRKEVPSFGVTLNSKRRDQKTVASLILS